MALDVRIAEYAVVVADILYFKVVGRKDRGLGEEGRGMEGAGSIAAESDIRNVQGVKEIVEAEVFKVERQCLVFCCRGSAVKGNALVLVIGMDALHDAALVSGLADFGGRYGPDSVAEHHLPGVDIYVDA